MRISHPLLWSSFLAAVWLLGSWPGQAWGQGTTLKLTPQERAFLKAHPVIRVGNEDDWPPFDYSVKGAPQGLAISYMKQIDAMLPSTFKYINGHKWSVLQRMSKERKLDVLPVLWNTEKRRAYLHFTRGYIHNPLVVVMKKDAPKLRSFADLKSVVMQAGVGTYPAIAAMYPHIKFSKVSTILEALLLVQSGKADACVDSLGIVSYNIKKHFLNDLQIHAGMVDKKLQKFNLLSMGVRKDWGILRDILQKALDAITEEQKNAIHRKWLQVGSHRSSEDFVLTPTEKKWLQKHPRVLLGITTEWAPIEFVDQVGSHRGMSSDYIKKIKRALGIELVPQQGLTWSQVLLRAKQGKLDALACAMKTRDRSRYMNFTKPYLSLPMVIIAHKDAPLIDGLRGLKGKKMAVVKGYAAEELLRRNWPEFVYRSFDTLERALWAVSDGSVDAFVGNLATITHKIKTRQIPHLRVAATTKYRYELSVAVRKDWPELIGILNRFIDSLSSREKKDIQHRWMNLHIDRRLDWQKLGGKVAIFLAFVALLLGVMFYWNRRLGKEVQERRLAEEHLLISNARLQEAKRAEELANRAKSKFLATMSHELRTPLNAIIGFTRLVKRKGAKVLPEKQVANLGKVLHSAEHLLSLINDILDLAKIEAGRVELESQTFNVEKLAREALSITRPMLREGVVLQAEFAPELPEAFADPGKTRQILLNLLSNAAKFTHEGEIRLSAATVGDPDSASGFLAVAVTDSGIGISEEASQRIFEEFQQADSTTTREYGGTGLGLTISHRLAHLMGGELTLESTLGEGSTFTLHLPLGKTAPQN